MVARPRLIPYLVAILLAAAAGAVYHFSVFSQFQPIRTGITDAETYASQRVVSIALPEVSPLEGHTAVLAVRLRNEGPEARHIGLFLEGAGNVRTVLPPRGDTSWSILLTPAAVHALAAPGDAARTLEFTGDASGWGVIRAEIRNYHARLGDRLVVVLPRSGSEFVRSAGAPLVWIVLLGLALIGASGGARQTPRFRLVSDGLAAAAFAVCLALLIVPRVSPYRPVLSPIGFVMLAAALFSSALPYAAWSLVKAPSLAGRYYARHQVTVERAAALLGLAAISVAQPVFEVVSNSPEFFAARGTAPSTLVATVLVIVLGLPLALFGIERAIRTISPRAAAIFTGVLLAVMTMALAMPALRRTGVFVFPWEPLAGALIGVAVAVAHSRSRTVRQFFIALAPAALVVPILFLIDPGVKQSFLASESAAGVQSIDRSPPIVLVIFDELPLNSLLDGAGELDAGRYPNFGALARDAYWFRNASTVTYNTSHAVPAILTGRYPALHDAVPTLRYYPVNLFTTLARHYSIFPFIRFPKLCPPRACDENAAMPGDTVRSLLSDLSLVWLHIILPERLTEDLPPVVGEWADFGRAREAPNGQGRLLRREIFAQFVASIDAQPGRLYVAHLVAPHMPFEYVPSGRRYRAPDHQTRMYRGKALFEGVTPAYADTLHQRHLAQVGFVDHLIGNLLARLREVGAYDTSLIIITADHGGSYREGRSRRQPRPSQHNLSDILQVPLFVKLPGQHRGQTIDRYVETVDILPTILDTIGAHAALRFDGHSLVDEEAAPRPATFYLRGFNTPPRALGDLAADRGASLERKERRFGHGDLAGLYAPPNARHLLGRTGADAALRPVPDAPVEIDNPNQFAVVKRDRDPLPVYVQGVVKTSRPDPLKVAVLVNGVVAAITESFPEKGEHMFGTLIADGALREEKNVVEARVID